MIGWCILAVFVVLLAVLLLLPIGADVEYGEDGILLRADVGPVHLQLLPKPQKKNGGKKKDKKAKKEKKKKEKKPKKTGKREVEQPKKKGGTVGLILSLLPVVLQALGALRRRILVKKLELHYTAGGSDAAKAAISYGTVSGSGAVLLQLLEQCFKIRERCLTVDVDFLAESSTVYLRLQISIRVGQVLYLAIRYGFACLKVWLGRKKKEDKSDAPKREKRRIDGKKKESQKGGAENGRQEPDR